MPSAPGVITDFDGTLADTRAANRAAYAAAFAEAGVPFPGDEYDARFGLGFSEMMAAIAPAVDAADLDRIAAAKARIYPAHFSSVRVNAALVAVLEGLRGGGSPIALASTARRVNLIPMLEAFGLAGLFSALVTAESVDRGKPAPDAYLLAARLLDRSPEDCIVFEDSVVGIRAAESAGCLVLKVVL